MQGLHHFDNALLADVLKRITAIPDYPHIAADIVALAVSIRAEIANRKADAEAEIYAPSATQTYREWRGETN